MQYSIHLPTPFIHQHTRELLPDWTCAVGAVLIVLQRPTCDLITRTHTSETQKDSLRETFLHWGLAIAEELQHRGYATDVFDPKTGQPLCSTPGTLWLDDVAVIRACLGYPSMQVEGCSVVVHPLWGSAVYPSVLMSAATPGVVRDVVSSVTMGGSQVRDAGWRTRSEYHHSFSG